ncbi:MAG TPA: bifunctional phosphoribosylaminoimidazolecarboxamide formyltransferase/IMP cyclohydrolase, partial [Thermoplasmata archaeon]|nr:bifunctional phosphoribosylaminoimidazolecarboxamide formyltransferase/IMP cyclohydrolase [Thermoplasmata archaeon]
MLKIRRALISVYDKRGIVEFAETLHQLKTELVASSGTATLLKMRGLPVTEISELTSHPEILEGRVKTLHPLVHGGILADKTKPEHLTSLKRYGIKPIDMVVVNLYPFEKEKDVTNLNGSLEYMDIGGNTLLRAAAKNFKNVAVVTEPELYAPISEELKRNGGALTQATLLNLAIKALTTTFQYELSILNYLQEFKSTHTYEEEGDHFVFKKEYKDESSNLFPHFVAAIYEKVSSLRYGENPHQKAALYRELKPFFPFSEKEVLFSGVINGEQLQGKALSYNNYVDLDGAVKILLDFD